jgi:CheY-like chemotaxis protein
MQLVEKMGGCISCTSSEGKGTTFSFSIPLPASASIALPDYDAGLFAPSSAALQHPPRLLIAEDNDVVRFAYGKLFRQEGVEVEFAVNGKDVLEKWATGHYDLIIMDLQMPEVDGIEATRIIRGKEMETGGHIPIIAMTGYAFREDRDRCLEAGMDGHLCKPVEFGKMLNAVRNALNC